MFSVLAVTRPTAALLTRADLTSADLSTPRPVRSQEVAENAALALEFRRLIEEDFDRLARQVAAMCNAAMEKMAKTMEKVPKAQAGGAEAGSDSAERQE